MTLQMQYEQMEAADVADLLKRIDELPLEEETMVHIICNCQDNTKRRPQTKEPLI